MITGYTSLKTVIAKLYRDLKISSEINEGYVVEWCAEALSKIGAYSQFVETKECLTLTNGRVTLPAGFYRLKDIAYKNRSLSWSTESMLVEYGCEGCVIPTCCSDYHFYISQNTIITDINIDDNSGTTDICIIYIGVPVDDDGYPLIPDNVYYMEAMAKYVTYMMDYGDWRKGNIPDKVFQKSENDWLFYVNSARGAANMPSLHQLENLKNMWVRLIPKQNEYNGFFKNNSNQERRYRY